MIDTNVRENVILSCKKDILYFSMCIVDDK